jgi:hypothetical protein
LQITKKECKMDIDAIIAEATIEVAPEQSAPEQAADDTSEVVTDEVETPEVKTESKQEEKPEIDLRNVPDSELTPEQLAKREQNRKSHTNSKLARLARENRELKARVEAAQQKPQEPQAPSLENFDSIDEYMDARDAYRESKLSAQDKTAPQITERQAQEFVRAADAEAAFEKAVPEYSKLVAENADFFREYLEDPKLQTAIFEAENAPLALYALMKEGLIGELYDLTPTRLAAELAKAEIRGQSYLVPKKTVTNAPAPIESVKGTGSGSKPIERMSPSELKAWLAS